MTADEKKIDRLEVARALVRASTRDERARDMKSWTVVAMSLVRDDARARLLDVLVQRGAAEARREEDLERLATLERTIFARIGWHLATEAHAATLARKVFTLASLHGRIELLRDVPTDRATPELRAWIGETIEGLQRATDVELEEELLGRLAGIGGDSEAARAQERRVWARLTCGANAE